MKHDEHGNIACYKAHLIACSFTQKPGIDFDETFTPVARTESICLLYALAASLD